MRILHTSDWHLGRQFHGMPLEEDHDFVLDQMKEIIRTHEPDLLIIAGDIFDRATPPQSALTRFGNFIRSVTDGGSLAVVAIAGNHDSPAQIGMMGVLPSGGRSLVRGPIALDEHPLVIPHPDGDVAVSALPFSYEFAARECFNRDDISCPSDVLTAQVESAKRLVPKDARWVVAAHTFLTGATTSENEKSLSHLVGGIETVSASIFDGAHYVALGHLHRPQSVGADHIRYSGAPLAFGFDETGDAKSVTIADLAADGSVHIQLVPLTPKRGIRIIRGKVSELAEAPEVCTDFVSVVLTDETPQIDPMRRIREKYPNAVQLSYEKRRDEVEERLNAGRGTLNDPKTVVSDFMTFVRQEGLSTAEEKIVNEALLTLRKEDCK